MGLETATYVKDLVAANPPGTDAISQGDDHLRLIKSVLQSTFATLAGTNLPTSTGTANAQAVTYNFAPSFYLPSETITFVAGFTNTGPCSIAVNGGSPVFIHFSGTDVAPGIIAAGSIYTLVYDGTYFQIMGSNVSGLGVISGGGIAIITDVTATGGTATLPAGGGSVYVHNSVAPLALVPSPTPPEGLTYTILDADGTAGRFPISFQGTVSSFVNPVLIDTFGGTATIQLHNSNWYKV